MLVYHFFRKHFNCLIMKKYIQVAVFVFLIVAFSEATAQTGQIKESGSNVTFSISHATGKVTGTFTGMQGSVNFDEQNPAAGSMEATVNAATINTNNRARDKDLRNEKFFYTEKYPEIHFRSKEISQTANGYQVKGDLTIKDQTKEIVIPFEQEKKDGQRIFTGTVTINRKDFNLGLKTFPPMGKNANVTIVAVVE